MNGGIVMSALASHSPRIGIEAQAPSFLRGVIAGEYALGRAINALAPDLIVLQSAHWVTTFTWYVTCHSGHHGKCVSDELPDLIPGVAYDRPGDPDFAGVLIEAIKAKGLLAGRNDTPHYKGTMAPSFGCNISTRAGPSPWLRWEPASSPILTNATASARQSAMPPKAPGNGSCSSPARRCRTSWCATQPVGPSRSIRRLTDSLLRC